MKRRRYLAGVAIGIGLAGCAGGDAGESTETAGSQRTDSPTPTSSFTRSPTQTQVATHSGTATPEETETLTPESTLTAEEVAQQHLEAAKMAIRAGVETWHGLAGNDRDWLDINAERGSEDFSFSAIGNASRDAFEEIRAARDEGVDSLQELLDAVEAELELLRTLARRQTDTHDLAKTTQTSIGSFGGETFRNSVQEFSADIGELPELFEAARAAGNELVADFGAKVAQFRNEADAYESFKEMFDDSRNADRILSDAKSELESGNYNTAQITAEDAERAFRDVLDEAEEFDAPTLSNTLDQLIGKLASKIDECRDVRREAAKKADEES